MKTSVVSDGGVRVPKRGVVKFSQNLSLHNDNMIVFHNAPLLLDSVFCVLHVLTWCEGQRWHCLCDPATEPGGKPALPGAAEEDTNTSPAV